MGGNVVLGVAESVAAPVGWLVTVALGAGDGPEFAFEIRTGPATKAVAATTTNAVAGTAKRTHLGADQPRPGLRATGIWAWGRTG